MARGIAPSLEQLAEERAMEAQALGYELVSADASEWAMLRELRTAAEQLSEIVDGEAERAGAAVVRRLTNRLLAHDMNENRKHRELVAVR